MKIYDESKFLSKIYQLNNSSKVNMFLNKYYKDDSGGQVVWIVKNENFKPLNKNKKSINDEERSKMLGVIKSYKNSFIKKKMEDGSVRDVTFSKDFLFKSFGHIAKMIETIASYDPRFLFVWNYNKEIRVKIDVWGKFKFEFSNLNDFREKTNPINDISKLEFWENFISLFPIKDSKGELINQEIKGFGQKSLEKLLQAGLTEENIIQFAKIDKETLYSRKSNAYNIVREIA